MRVKGSGTFGRPVQLWLRDVDFARLDRIAEKAGIKRSDLMRNLILVGLEEVETFDALGLVRFVRVMERMRDAIRGVLLDEPEKVSA